MLFTPSVNYSISLWRESKVHYHLLRSILILLKQNYLVKTRYLWITLIYIIGFGHEVPVSAFLPDSAILAKLLNDEVKHSSAAIFVTASMDPQKVQLLDISLMCVHIYMSITLKYGSIILLNFENSQGSSQLKFLKDMCMSLN